MRPSSIVLAALMVPSLARAADVKVYNRSERPLTIYWVALGCAGIVDDRPFVCGTSDVAHGASVSYDFPAGTSDRRYAPSCSPKPEGTNLLGPYGRTASGTDFVDTDCDSGSGNGAPAGLTPRADVKYEVLVGAGMWGDWFAPIYCDSGPVNGARLRVESGQGGGDDTALNAIQFNCFAGGSRRTNEGYWGSSGEGFAICPSGWITKARIKIEARQGGGDDTAANDVEFGCSEGSILTSTNGGKWGDWGAWAECPADTAVCGMSVRVEPPQGGEKDDTALNGLKLECCPR